MDNNLENIFVKILHYVHGTTPVRGGGLIKYAQDLMIEQHRQGKKVVLLIPGSVNRKRRNETKIEKNHNWEQGIEQYRIKNALPIPMCNGIQDIEWYTTEGDYQAYYDFLDSLQPDVIHVHSVMGIHVNFFVAAHNLKIPVIFTTHDYFGICPKTDLVNCNGNCDRVNWDECEGCCENAFSHFHVVLEQSRIYRFYRNSQILINIGYIVIDLLQYINRKKIRREVRIENQCSDSYRTEKSSRDYTKLKKYYETIFKHITLFHYNSNVTKTEYEKRVQGLKGKVLSITNATIVDNREKKIFGSTLRIGYMGRIDREKGFYLIQDVVQQMVSQGKINIELHVYTREKRDWPNYVHAHVPYKYEQMAEVMRGLDMVVVPSLWWETFGFTALEAISYGLPVVVTENVGAKDLLVNNEWGFVVQPDKKAMCSIIEQIYDDRDILRKVNEEICKGEFEFSIGMHVYDVEKLYVEAIRDLKE